MSTKIIQTFAGALWGLQIGSTTMTAVNAVVKATSLNDTLNKYFTEKFGKLTPTEIGELLVTNLGISAAGKAEAVAYVVGKLGAASPATYGQVISGILTDFAGLTANATFGAAATAWNAKVATAEAYTGAGDLAVGTIVGGAFTLTTGADTPVMTLGDDVINATVTNSLSATDKIIDASTTDKDVLTAKMNAAAAATVVNVETVNIDWTSNADMAVTATNMAKSGLNLSASGLAFTGVAAVTDAGDNNVTAGTGIAALTMTNIVDSKINAGAATGLTIDAAATVPTVGQRTTADITANKAAFTITNTTGDQVAVLKVTNTVADAVISVQGAASLTGSGIGTSLAVNGAVNTTVRGVVTGETITNGLTAGTLSVVSSDVGAIDATKIAANLITLSGAGTAVTVAANQNLAVTTGGALTSLVAGTGLTNVTTNLSTSVGIAALDVTAISNLNLTVTKDVTNGLTTNAGNNITIAGSGANTMTVTGVAAVDASAATGKQTIITTDNNSGIIGSATAINAITSANATSNLTFIGGSANDTVGLVANTGAIKLTMGAGNDTVTVGGALTGSNAQTIDGGDGTDTLKIDAVTGVAAATTGSSRVVVTGFENIVAVTGTNFNNAQLSGSTATFIAQSADAAMNVMVFDRAGTATTSTLDLSGLTMGSSTGANFATVNIFGRDGSVDTIKGTKVSDVIDAGTSADIIDISQGGADILVMANGDSTFTSSSNKVDKITGFNATSSSSTNDKLDFAVATVQANAATVDVKTAITSGTGAETVVANVTNGIMTISGVNSSAIDTLVEYQAAAKIATASAFETFTLTLDPTLAVAGTDSTITFDGVTTKLADLDDATKAGDALAAGVFPNWTATNAAGTVTFVSKVAGSKTDAVIGNFTFAEGVAPDTGLTGAVLVTVQGTAGGVAGETVAFEFGGSTYVYNYVDGVAGTDNLVELVGLTGITSVTTTAAANGIFIL